MQIAQSKTREQFPLNIRKVLKKTITSTIFWLILFFAFIIGILIAAASPDSGISGYLGIAIFGSLVLVLLIVLLTYFYQLWYYSVYFYDLTDHYIVIRKGPITPSEITVPFERIQDIYVDQDLFDRIFGLYDVHISSATFSSGIAAHIDGVVKVHADGLRALILEKVHEKISLRK